MGGSHRDVHAVTFRSALIKTRSDTNIHLPKTPLSPAKIDRHTRDPRSPSYNLAFPCVCLGHLQAECILFGRDLFPNSNCPKQPPEAPHEGRLEMRRSFDDVSDDVSDDGDVSREHFTFSPLCCFSRIPFPRVSEVLPKKMAIKRTHLAIMAIVLQANAAAWGPPPWHGPHQTCGYPGGGPTATIDSGVVTGTTTSFPDATATVNKFLGVPFAKSPPTRFAPPESAGKFSGPIIAKEWSPACIQQFTYPKESQEFTEEVFNNPPPEESEDCL